MSVPEADLEWAPMESLARWLEHRFAREAMGLRTIILPHWRSSEQPAK